LLPRVSRQIAVQLAFDRISASAHTYDKPDDRVERRNGRITYRGALKSIVEGYRTPEVKTEADLLWLAFAWNHTGVTWCDISERSVIASTRPYYIDKYKITYKL